MEYFNKVIDNLSEDENIGIIAVGGKEEMSLSLHKEKIIDLRGVTSLLDLAAVLKKGNVLLTNDSSPVHIGSASENTRIIALFGPTVKEFGFFPWSRNSEVMEINNLSCRPCGMHGGKKCSEGHFKCMRDITPEAVTEAIKKYLGKDKNG